MRITSLVSAAALTAAALVGSPSTAAAQRPAAADAARRAAKADQIAVSTEDAAGKDVRVSLARPLDIFAEDRPTVPVVRLDRVTLTRAVAADLDRARVETATRPAPLLRLQQNPQKAGWIKRHPILFGTLIGFGTGFVIGCLPHEDNALYLFPGCYNGLYVGGIGAGIGAAAAAGGR